MQRFLLLLLLSAIRPALALGAADPHRFLDVAISPDGHVVADVEGVVPPAEFVPPVQHLVLRQEDGGGTPVTVALPCGEAPQCWPSSLTWTHDGHRLAFALRTPGTHTASIYAVSADGTGLTRLLQFDGTLTDLRYGPHDALAVLAVAGADKEVGAAQAGAPLVGTLGTNAHEERIGVLDGTTLRWASPPDLFVYQYDWRPDGSGFVGQAAHGDGDNNYWFARLYAFGRASGQATELFHPGGAEQIADPVVSPDGHHVAFIGGIMSDFGAIGGDVFLLDLSGHGATPVDIMPGAPRSAMSLGWNCHDGTLGGQVLQNDRFSLVSWGRSPSAAAVRTLLSGPAMLRTDAGDALSVACAAGTVATVHQGWGTPPEIEAGAVGNLRDISHENAGQSAPVVARSLDWQVDGHQVQGWLLLPASADGKPLPGPRPTVTVVHGGPAWVSTPTYLAPGMGRDLLERGTALFLPNPRGSFGQGEAFTRGNVGDFGHGDFRDIMGGVDAAVRTGAVDSHRLGITGGSYGGYMTMWAVTQTDRFRAAVAVAGVSDWTSMMGTSDVESSMRPYYPKSIYIDPAPYARSSPINFIAHVHTPTAEYVGQNDIECPPGQTEEFWHALVDLGVPTEAVIYPGDGHGFRDPKNAADARRRAVAWFDKYMKG